MVAFFNTIDDVGGDYFCAGLRITVHAPISILLSPAATPEAACTIGDNWRRDIPEVSRAMRSMLEPFKDF